MLHHIAKASITRVLPFKGSQSFRTLFFFSMQQAETQGIDPPIQPQKVKSLQNLITQRNGRNIRELFETDNDKMFEFGMNPFEFRLHYLIYFKYSFWQSSAHAKQRLLFLIHQCKVQEKQIKDATIEQAPTPQQLAKLELIQLYRKQIAIQLLPGIISEYQYTNEYLQQLSCFLEQTKHLNQNEIYYIVQNLYRIIYGSNELNYFNNDKDNAWLITHAFNLFLDRCLPHMSTLPFTLKSNLISIARSLRSHHVQFLQFLKRDLQKDRKQISLQVFLAALLYLGYHNSFPYEYFYRNKDSLMAFIESAEDFSEKKVTVSICMLEIFSRHRLPYCQKIIHRLLTCIEHNLVASDITQLARIFFFYSRLKCGIQHSFVIKIVDRIYQFMDSLDQKHYLLIIKAVANLNYKDDLLIQKLKDYNYELFLSSLKFGCDKLGSYYRAILDEVETSFKADSNRYYKQQDEPFTDDKPVQSVQVASISAN